MVTRVTSALFCLLFSVPALAEFPEREIEIIIPYTAGGGFDTYVRALAPRLEAHLPNNVGVLPVNSPGAGGRRGASETFRARSDGYTLGVFNLPGIMIPQLRGGKVGYDLSEMTWLATLSDDPYAFIVKGDSSVDSIEDLKNLGRPISYSATGPSSTAHAATVITNEKLGLPSQIVTGYRGSTDCTVGVIRGDVDASLVSLSTARAYIKSGDVKMIALIGAESQDPAISDATDLGIPELSEINVVRMIGGPPGIPEDVRQTLEKAFLAALDDPEFKAWLEKTGNTVAPAGSEETAQAVDRMDRFYQKFEHVLQ